ncbi:MAG: flavodoxin family protein [Clostridiales bacterium]|nr:flavodoxin family protein [Clostridiales bacterium]
MKRLWGRKGTLLLLAGCLWLLAGGWVLWQGLAAYRTLPRVGWVRPLVTLLLFQGLNGPLVALAWKETRRLRWCPQPPQPLWRALNGRAWLLLVLSLGGSLWLREAGPIPKDGVAVVCTALGGGLLLAGALFWVALVREKRKNARERGVQENIQGGNQMKIVVITGSPHRHGTSALLADRFIQGAREGGHEIFRFDAAFQDLHPCLGCDRCRQGDKVCVWKDDMTGLNPHLLAADMIVFASPIYYYDWSAQLKLAMDRFYGLGEALRVPKKSALLLTMEDDTMESAAGAILSYQGMTNYLGWERVGVISALGCGDLEAMEKTSYPQEAYELGKSL